MWRSTVCAVFALTACALQGTPGANRPIGPADSTAALLAALDTVLQAEPSQTLTPNTPACVKVLGMRDPDTGRFSYLPPDELVAHLSGVRPGTRMSDDCFLEMSNDPSPGVAMTLFPLAFFGRDSATAMLTMARTAQCSPSPLCIPANPADAMLFIHLTYSRETWLVDRITMPEALF